MAIQLSKRLFTVAEFTRMAEGGVLREDDRVELLEGEVVEMTPIGARHAFAVMTLDYALSEALSPEQAVRRIQSPIQLGEFSQLQPDIALVRPPLSRYAARHPQAPDVFLLVEVAQTSADYDREVKVPLYAQHGVAEVWLIDLNKNRLECFREPAGQGYQSRQTPAPHEALAPASLPDCEIRLQDLPGFS